MTADKKNRLSIRLAAAILCSLAIAAAALLFESHGFAQSTPAKPAAAHTYYMFIFSNPAAGREDEYNKWYNEQHAPDVVSVPGFVSAQRFIFCDVQLRGKDAAPPKGLRYMVMYKIVTNDLDSVYAEVRRRLGNGMTRTSTSMDNSVMMGATYEAITDPVMGTNPAGVDTAKVGSLPVYYQLVFADPKPESEAEYNKWYNEHHVPEITAVPGFVSGQRFVFSSTQLNKDTSQKYLAMFKIVTPDIAATIKQFQTLAPNMTDSPAFKTSGTVGYTYKAIGPLLDGDAIRAERAKSGAAH